ncbi:GntR family transcriptional regulator [Actinomycetospora sp. TBRC 11914]|nr:GntR family transcriptional regulator [Actinomycetospora sp. TBRC 11914]NMO88981.1 GntR family transcriptional regulator [Actinomycetospora sp. TBRC 11914]
MVSVTDPVTLIDVDPSSSVAPYEQVRASVTALVRSGALAPHTRLPAVRRLAVDLGLAANTVARAYRELEAAGVVETRGRLGTFVVDPSAAEGGGRDEAREAAREYAARMRSLGVSPERAVDLARAALADG